jgi:hypothetical protein
MDERLHVSELTTRPSWNAPTARADDTRFCVRGDLPSRDPAHGAVGPAPDQCPIK